MDESRREVLVRSAFTAIARAGFEGLRLREVATAAGIDHSTVHHYFRTKQELVAATVAYSTGLFSVSLATEGPPCVRLHDHFEQIADLMLQHPEIFVVMNEISQHALRDEVTRKAVEAQYRGWSGAVVGLLEDGAAQGCWNSVVDAVASARLIMASMQGINRSPEAAASVLAQLESLLLTQTAPADGGHVHQRARKPA